MAQANTGVMLPEKKGMPSTAVYPVEFNDSYRGNIYILDPQRRHKGHVSDVLQAARSHGVVAPDEHGSLIGCLPEGMHRINETPPATSETHELPQAAIEHVAKLFSWKPDHLQVTQRYSAGRNGSTFQLGDDIVLKIFEPYVSSKTKHEFLRSAAIQRIIYSIYPDLVPKIYRQVESLPTDNLMLAGVEKPFIVMERVVGRTVEEPTAEDAADLGKTLARFHTMSGAIIAELGEDAFENTPKAVRRVDRELLGQAVLAATGLAEPHTGLGILLKSVVLAPLLYRKLDTQNLPRGVLHMDFHWSNCLLGDKPRVIDFDGCAIGAFVEDIANTIPPSFVLPMNGTISCRVDLVQSFLEGYNSVRQLTPAEFKALPIAMEEQVNRFILRNNRYAAKSGHWATRVMPKDQFKVAVKAILDDMPLLNQAVASVAIGSGMKKNLS